ncbi:Uncharacterised protein [Vibrio cholerae]|nr:Uncharacterised protein [Vibrio cholerae]
MENGREDEQLFFLNFRVNFTANRVAVVVIGITE